MKSVVRLTDRPDMTLDVYSGRKTTIRQYDDVLGLTPNEKRAPRCKTVRIFCDKITGNQQPVHLPLFLQVLVNIFRIAKGVYCFCHTGLQPYKCIFECCRLT